MAVAVVAAVGGYRLGFIAGATSWVFLLQGLLVASLATPALVDGLGGASLAARLILGAVLFVGAGWSAQFAGRWAGRAYREALLRLHRPGAGPGREELMGADRMAGAVVGPVMVLVVVWMLVLPALGAQPGWAGRLARQSAIATGMGSALPAPPDASQALRHLTRPVALPEVLTALGPAGDSSPPPKKVVLSPDVVQRVTASTVMIQGESCWIERRGSGFAIDRDLVVTNAHVVAGEDAAAVVRPDGKRLPATVVVYDPDRDLALLRVTGLGQQPLPLGTAKEGSPAAVFGHPDGQDAIAVSPADIRQRLVATVRDGVGATPARRSVFVLAADLAPGDSGGALITPSGHVAGVAFAISNSRSGVAFAVTSDEIRPLLQRDRSGVADTGGCI